MPRLRETRLGFTEGDTVKVISDPDFAGCVSNISMFDGPYAILYFTHPSEGHNPTSRRFLPGQLQLLGSRAIPETRDA